MTIAQSLLFCKQESDDQYDKILKDPTTITETFALAHSQNYDLSLFLLNTKVPCFVLEIPAMSIRGAGSRWLWSCAISCPGFLQLQAAFGTVALLLLHWISGYTAMFIRIIVFCWRDAQSEGFAPRNIHA